MNSHCLPFRQVPHSTKLFLDFLDNAPAVRQFLPHSPQFLHWAQDESARVSYPAERRTRVADTLERQNKSFGASPKTLENISAFRSGALAIVTGQQVGLFGGPAFALYKALSAVRFAGEATRLGIDCVPIFWLATEDHDLEEVNHTRIPGAEAQLETFASQARGVEDAPVGGIKFENEITEVVLRAESVLGESEITRWLKECYAPGESFGSAFAKLFSRLFADFGVILLDGSDPELDRLAVPLYQDVIDHAGELNRSLLERDKELQAAGYHQQVRITSSTTPLFVFQNGSRLALHSTADGRFSIAEKEFSHDDLMRLAASSPELLSPNVLLRPIMQDYLLPTLAYVGGSAEVAYFAQLGALYQRLAKRITPILPRFSATLIDSKPQALLERYKLSFSDVFHGPEALREKIGSELLGANLQGSFQRAKTAVQTSMAAVQEALAQLDKTLTESAQNAESKMLYQLTNLQSRAARAELRQSEVADRHARLLSNWLYPDKALQEREFAGVYLLAKYGNKLLEDLLTTIHPDCVDHQLISIPAAG